LIEPVLSAWRFERRGRALDFDRPPEHDLRDIMDVILYVDRTGVQWRYHLPHDFPHWNTEIAVADIRPADIADAVVEGDQVSRYRGDLGKPASRDLIVVVSRPDLVGPGREAVLILELACHGRESPGDSVRPRGQPGGRKRSVTHETGS
jgi:hypothetical protein